MLCFLFVIAQNCYQFKVFAEANDKKSEEYQGIFLLFFNSKDQLCAYEPAHTENHFRLWVLIISSRSSAFGLNVPKSTERPFGATLKQGFRYRVVCWAGPVSLILNPLQTPQLRSRPFWVSEDWKRRQFTISSGTMPKTSIKQRSTNVQQQSQNSWQNVLNCKD